MPFLHAFQSPIGTNKTELEEHEATLAVAFQSPIGTKKT